MRRAALLTLVLAGVGCSTTSSNPAMLPHPDWNGPAVHVRHRADRGLDIELVAPTGGHQFLLQEVVMGPYHVELRCSHRKPTADVVTQVITTHKVEVPAERLGNARVITVTVATDGGPVQLALASARP